MDVATVHPPTNRWIMMIEKGVFAIRWMLIPQYVGLVAALGLYIAHFVHEVFDMFEQFWWNYSAQNVLMLFILELVDMAMISQLVVMTIQGGYAIFIRPFDPDIADSLPQWIRHGLGTSEQKIKLGMSILGIMIVQMLTNFIKMSGFTHEQLWMRLEMIAAVAVVTLMFCIYNLLMHPDMLRAKASHADQH